MRKHACSNLDNLDPRYRARYGMSVVVNLREIAEKGTETFLKNQEAKYNCPNCGGVIWVHGPKMLRERSRYLQLKNEKNNEP